MGRAFSPWLCIGHVSWGVASGWDGMGLWPSDSADGNPSPTPRHALRQMRWPPGFHFALKVNRYGETETGYLSHLKKTIYRHKAAALGYGLKLWPEDFATVKAKAPEAFNLEGL